MNAILTVYAAEYEHAIRKAVTLGVGATYWNVGGSDDAVTYASGDFKFRYYPQGLALSAFSAGGSLGYSRVNFKSTSSGLDESAGGVSLGFLMEYQWLLGATKNFAVTVGAGAKTLFVNGVDNADFTGRYPTLRLSIGYAF